MLKRINGRLIIFLAICIAFVITSLLISSLSVRATENNIKKSVAQFSNKPETSIVKLKELTINNKKFIILDDGEYNYNVSEDGTIRTITAKNSFFEEREVKISKEFAVEKANDLMKKLNKSFKNSTMDVSERMFENNQAFTVIIQEKNDLNINTGNIINVDLFPNGKLKGLSIKTETSNITSQGFMISKDEAKQILLNYFNTHEILNKYANFLSGNNYTLEKNVFHGTNVWEFNGSFNEISDNFTFRYLIDSNTGKIILKSEPRMSGFN